MQILTISRALHTRTHTHIITVRFSFLVPQRCTVYHTHTHTHDIIIYIRAGEFPLPAPRGSYMRGKCGRGSSSCVRVASYTYILCKISIHYNNIYERIHHRRPQVDLATATSSLSAPSPAPAAYRHASLTAACVFIIYIRIEQCVYYKKITSAARALHKSGRGPAGASNGTMTEDRTWVISSSSSS